MDSLFDNLARYLATPKPRRATLRVLLRGAAGAAIVGFLPVSKALAWEKCGNTSCAPGLSCCNDLTSTCCKADECVAGVCTSNTVTPTCPTSQVCVGVPDNCCPAGTFCCTSGAIHVCCPNLPGVTCDESGTCLGLG